MDKFGASNVTVVRTEAVGPRVGSELRRNALIAILISFAITLIYLAIRFEWRFGLAAVLATSHDIFTTVAFLKLMHLEVSLTVVAALLTVLGYSLNDTIIIFDRVRENLRRGRKGTLYDILNESINETLPRSVLTHMTTAAAVLALLLFAGEVIRPCAWVMLFGIVTGTFSSVYVAGPLLLWIERKYPRAAAAWKPSSTPTPTSQTRRSTATATR
jgi:preprotein translocase subunit SecF